MNYGPKGLALTRSFEGCKLTAYQDSGGVWTVGYGATGPTIGPDTVWTQEEADTELLADIQWAQGVVNTLVTAKINQNQNDALVDFCFNVGSGNFRGSTLLRCVNQGRFDLAAGQFALWVHAAGEVIPGLIRRRQAEANLFLEAV